MIVLVTGGTRGLGRGLSEAFLDEGHDVVVCGRSEPERLPAAAVIVVWPGLTCVTTPVGPTVAMVISDDVHTAVVSVMSRGGPF